MYIIRGLEADSIGILANLTGFVEKINLQVNKFGQKSVVETLFGGLCVVASVALFVAVLGIGREVQFALFPA